MSSDLTPEREAEIRRLLEEGFFGTEEPIDILLAEIDRLRTERDAAVQAALELERAKAREDERTRCAKYLLYLGGTDDEVILDILRGEFYAESQNDKDVERELVRLRAQIAALSGEAAAQEGGE